jgi:glycerophosphoryl diester phosphodiesterase
MGGFGKRRMAVLVAVMLGMGVYFLNCSWLASRSLGQPRLLAQRGIHQTYRREEIDDRTCTARLIATPTHALIENTLPSIDAAFAMGADAVEVDTRITKDRQFVLFHDGALECRTDGHGPLAEHTLAELQALDVGFGYTAYEDRSFPLRGRGIGLMASLEEALRVHRQSRFVIQFKDADASSADSLVSYLEARDLAQWDRLSFFGAIRPLERLKVLRPTARVWSAGAVARCLKRYILVGWTGYVPEACADGVVIVPVTQAGYLWGWPNRFLARMRERHSEVMLIGRITGFSGSNFSRLDSAEELKQVPIGFDGTIWTDHIEIVGPAVVALTGSWLVRER